MSEDGAYAVAGFCDKRVRCWNLADGSCVDALVPRRPAARAPVCVCVCVCVCVLSQSHSQT